MAGPAAAAVPVYVGGAAVFYGFMYAVSPEFRAAHEVSATLWRKVPVMPMGKLKT